MTMRLRLVLAISFSLLGAACGDSENSASDAGTSLDGAPTTDGGGLVDGSVSGPLPPYRSGSRLRANLINGAGEGGVFVDWYDSMHDEACEFVETVDGLRCLPGAERSLGFLDAACTDAVVFSSECPEHDGPPRFLGRVFLRTCGQLVFEPYQETSTMGMTMNYFVRNNDGDCLPIDSPPMTPLPYIQVERVETSEFVGAAAVEVQQNEFLSARYYQASDGAVQAVDLVDRRTGLACSLAGPDDGARPCIPQIPAWVIDLGINGYVTEDCSALLAYTTGCGPEMPAYAQLLAPRPCENNGPGLVELGAEVPAARVMDGNVGMCEGMTDAPESYSFYEVRREVPASELGSVQRIRLGSGPVQSLWWSIDGVTPLLADRRVFYDTVRETQCRLSPEFDGSARCVPDTARFLGGNSFSDVACTEPLDVRTNVSAACPGDPPPSEFYVSRSDANGCNQTFELYDAGELLTPSTVYFGTSVDCNEASGIPADTEYREVGPRLAFDVYPELESARE